MIQEEVRKAAEFLKQGGIILYPTDTVWGIGCDATNTEAVKKVNALKERAAEKSLIVLLDSDAKVERYVRTVPEVAWDLIEHSDPPITIIYPEGVAFAKGVCALDGSVAIRVTNNEFCKRLIHRMNRPLVSTSANFAKKPTPASFRDIDPAILDAVDYVVNLAHQETSSKKPSAIIKIALNGEFEFIRR